MNSTTSDPAFQDLRNKHKIPDYYGRGLRLPSGEIIFDYYDSTITIHLNGTATETHMGLGINGHEFFTQEWPPLGRAP